MSDVLDMQPALQFHDRQADGAAVSKYVSVTECQYH